MLLTLPYIPDGNGQFLATVFFTTVLALLILCSFLAWVATMIRDVRIEAHRNRPRVEEQRVKLAEIRSKERTAPMWTWTETRTVPATGKEGPTDDEPVL